jgi:hypothetical protein
MCMDELEISGKRYISAKRIAKENQYHSDYVGQLIRAGRIIGTKVGRAWYVDEASFNEYLGKERGSFETPMHVRTEPVQRPPVAFTQPEENFTSRYPTSPAVQTVYPQEPQEFAQELPVRKFFVEEAPVIEKKPVVKTSLTYLSDNSPLFPAIQKRAKEMPKPIVPQAVEPYKEEYTPADTIYTRPVTLEPTKKRSVFKLGLALVSLTLIAGVFFTFAFFGSVGINSTLIVEQGKPASVMYSQEKTLCFIFNDCQSN